MKNDLNNQHGVHLCLAFKGSHLITHQISRPGKPRKMRKGLHKCYSSVHAEVAMIQYLEQQKMNIKKMKFVVVRVRIINGILSLHESHPCLNCACVLVEYGISSMLFSTRHGTIEHKKISDILQDATPSTGTRIQR